MDAIKKALIEQAGGSEEDWEYMEGPDSGVGVDYWFYNDATGQEAYVNVDQGEYTVEVMDGDE